jgi:hypothetical protein
MPKQVSKLTEAEAKELLRQYQRQAKKIWINGPKEKMQPHDLIRRIKNLEPIKD